MALSLDNAISAFHEDYTSRIVYLLKFVTNNVWSILFESIPREEDDKDLVKNLKTIEFPYVNHPS